MTVRLTSTAIRFKLSDDVVLQAAGEEAVLVKLNAEDVFGLNATGVDIVRRIAGGLSIGEAIDQLSTAYAGDRDAIAADVGHLVTILVERGLLEPIER